MVRARWLLGLSVMGLFSLGGCGLLPGSVGSGPGFALVVSAPEAYRGNSSLTMRLVMPRHGAYGVAALASDIERIDVTLRELGALPVSMPGSGPTRPHSEPKGVPDPGIPQPEPAPLPADMEQWPTILPDVPPLGVPVDPPSIPAPPPPSQGQSQPTGHVAPPPPRLEKPLVEAPAVVAKASIGRGELDKGQGDVVFNALKAGAYGLELVAYGKDGRMLGTSMQRVEIRDGQTAMVDATLVLVEPGQGGNVSVGVTIVEGGASGPNEATASPAILIAPAPPPRR